MMTDTFAGFSYPKRIAIYRNTARTQSRNLTVAGGPDAVTASGKTRKTRWCFVYYAVTPNPVTRPRLSEDAMRSFYHASDFMPGLRWQWAKDVVRSISYAGYRPRYDMDAYHGIVFRLPHGRGFLAGWSMGDSMCGAVHCHVIEDEDEAARTADDMAAEAADDEARYIETEQDEDADQAEGED